MRRLLKRWTSTLAAEPAPVTAPVDAPSVVVERAPSTSEAVFVALVPTVFCAPPTPEVEFRAPAPADSCAAPAPEVEFVAPAPAASCAAPAPVDEFVAPTPADSCAAPPPVAEYVTQAPFEPDEARPPVVVGRPGSVRRRHVVKAPPVVDSGAVERAEPAGFVSAEPVAPAVEPDVSPAHGDEAAPSMRVSPPQAHDPVQAMMVGYRDLDPRTRGLT